MLNSNSHINVSMKILLFVDQHAVGYNLKCFYFKMIQCYIDFY